MCRTDPRQYTIGGGENIGAACLVVLVTRLDVHLCLAEIHILSSLLLQFETSSQNEAGLIATRIIYFNPVTLRHLDRKFTLLVNLDWTIDTLIDE